MWDREVIIKKLVSINDPRRNATMVNPRRRNDLTVITLGTGIPIPDAFRSGFCNAVIHKKTCILVDCGRWASRQVLQARIPFNQINGLILSHLHQDHLNGWPVLWMDSLFTRRTKPWKIWGPIGTTEVMDSIRIFNGLDIKDRDHSQMNLEGLITEITEIKGETSWMVEKIKVTAVQVPHIPTMPCFGFRFDTPGKSIIISCDTTRSEALIELGKRAPVDILVHEVILDDIVRFAIKNGFMLGTPETAETIIRSHSTIEQVIEVANEIKPKKLVISHFVPSIASPAYIEEEISKKFDGEVICANDLDAF